ncbi:MAG: peptidoglycan-associated lipoprotein Pal [Rhodobacteraceae bacterium]|nr:peptidoglycan-associated lipoprotein Pal [Paracoccaceae bacterium]
MGFLARAALVVLVLGVAACSNDTGFGDDATVSGANRSGIDTDPHVGGGLGVPTSPVYFQQRVGDRVLFAVDQSTLSAEARAILDGQAQWLLTNDDFTAVIEGHADERGTREYNLALGARRTNAVREYLVSRNVPEERLQVVSYGKERPIEICSAEVCYSKNRRAVTVLASGVTG